ncbi:diguanylate cyclase [Paenibacillus cisolokensis]|uniref:GGDEF domain-containing protein n=1 Tax=Paenibacillus cisolokensis TaxID=1658519 RepID=UPI003D2A15DA
MLNSLLINFCILATFLYISGWLTQRYALSMDTPSLKVKIYAGILFGLIGQIMMLHSFPIDMNLTADLRHLVMMVAAIYFGWIPAIISGLLIGFGRMVIFGVSISSVIIGSGMLLIAVISGWISTTRLDRMTKMQIMNAGSMVIHLLVILTNMTDHDRAFIFFVTQLLVSTIAVALLCLLTEYTYASNKLLLQINTPAAPRDMTNLSHLKQFEQRLSERFLEAQHFGERLGLIIVDIDHFKKINDTYGHEAGDAVLLQLGNVMKEHARSFDEVSRSGGDEFTVLVPEATPIEMTAIAERIREAVEKHTFLLHSGTKLHLTVSVGVAVHPDTMMARQAIELLEQADQELYRAKNTGRNKVCIAPGLQPPNFGVPLQ